MNYLLTFRTYGTWLHGDERGSVDREHNQFGEPLLQPSHEIQQRAKRMMKAGPCVFSMQQRQCVEQTIREVGEFRGWTLSAVAVLSNHVHVVVTVPDDTTPERAMNDFKVWATRRLREKDFIEAGRPVWERHGSTRPLLRANEVEAACAYVINQINKETEEPEA